MVPGMDKRFARVTGLGEFRRLYQLAPDVRAFVAVYKQLIEAAAAPRDDPAAAP